MSGEVLLTRRAEFSASHFYYNPALSPEENVRLFGKSANRQGHGHNYTLEVTVAGEPDAQTGMVVDLKELKEILQREVLELFDHRSLNHEVPAFRDRMPTTENIAVTIWDLLAAKIRKGRLHRVRVYETPDLFVDYYGGGTAA